MDQDLTKEEIYKRFLALPEAVQDVILDENEPKILREIAAKNSLESYQIDLMIRLVGHTSIGIVPFDQFGNKLVSVCKISPEAALNIAREIDRVIFSRIREAMQPSSVLSKYAKQELPNTSSVNIPRPPLAQSTTIKRVAPNRPPVTPFISADNVGVRFGPITKTKTDLESSGKIKLAEVPRYTTTTSPNLYNSKDLESLSEKDISNIVYKTGAYKKEDEQKETFNPLTRDFSKIPPLPPKPFTPPPPQAPIEPIGKTTPPGKEVVPVPKPAPQSFNPNRIGKEIVPTKATETKDVSGSSNLNTTFRGSEDTIKQNLRRTGFYQRGKFGQGVVPYSPYFRVTQQNVVRAIPKDNIPPPPPINIPNTNTSTRPEEMIMPISKSTEMVRSENENKEYVVDPYRETID
jgi:hypothetical protein